MGMTEMTWGMMGTDMGMTGKMGKMGKTPLS